MSKIIIIGAGASGMVASIFAAKNNNEVIILERNDIIGKKILSTGNGRCNYWNENFNINNFNSNNIELLEKIICRENQKKVLNFFQNIGIISKIKEGCFYPFSNQATTMQKALLTEAYKSNVKIIYNTTVNNMIYENNKFKILTNNGDFISDKVILSSGSKAYPKTGSDGFSYLISEKFGHSIIKVLPALVQLIGKEKYFKEWTGIRTDVIVKLIEDEKEISNEQGEIQLTDYGVSGICVFQLSGRVAKGLFLNKKEMLSINFLPFLEGKTLKEVIDFLDNRNDTMKNRTIFELLEGILNIKLLNVIFKRSKLDKNFKWDGMNNDLKKNLINNLINFSILITNTKSFDNAQVCSGGIPLDEINVNTMESLKQKNLYLTGELLDVDGKCGGFNLGFAWLTGMIAGDSID